MATFASLSQNYKTAPGVSVQDWSGSLTVSTGSVEVVTDQVDTEEGMTRSLKVNYNGSAAGIGRMTFSTATTAGQGPNSICVRLMAPATNAAPAAVRLYLYNAGLTANITWYHSVPNDGVWRTYYVPFAGTTATSWTLGTTVATQVRVDEDRTGNRGVPGMKTGEYFLVGAVILNRRARSKFLIYLDDNRRISPGGTAGAGGYPASGGTYEEVLDFYGFPATITVNPSYIGNTSETGLEQNSLSELRRLETEGWSVCTRSIWTSSGNIGNAFHGLRTLGTYGNGPFTVASIDDTTDILTVTAHPFANSKVKVSAASMPGGLDAVTDYWARNVSSNTITLHTSYAGAVANTGKVDITSTGSGVTLRWSDAVVGKSLIRSTISADLNAMQSLGFGAWDHYQTAQGGADQEVQEVLDEFAQLKTVRGVGSAWNGSVGIGRNGAVPDWIGTRSTTRNLGACFDMQTIGSATTITNINSGVRDGATMAGYLHSVSAGNATILDAVCAHLLRLKRQGLIDVVTVEQWYDGLTAARRLA